MGEGEWRGRGVVGSLSTTTGVGDRAFILLQALRSAEIIL